MAFIFSKEKKKDFYVRFSLEAAGQVFRFLVLDLTGQTEKKKTNEEKKSQNDPHW